MRWQRLSWILALAHRRPQSVEELGRNFKARQRFTLSKAFYPHTRRKGGTFEPRQIYGDLSLPTAKKKRTEIIIEIDELTLIKSSQNASIRDWCPGCAGIVNFVPPELAAAIAGVAVRTINQWVEAESVHFVETNTGLLLLCVNSLK